MNCEVTKLDGYQDTMFQLLPQLKYLDNADKNGGSWHRLFTCPFDVNLIAVEKDSDDDDDDDEDDEDEGDEKDSGG
jgi:hypothetical protein